VSAVTFTRVTQTEDASTGLITTASTTIGGNAVIVRGRPDRYQALGLAIDRMPTLLFTPTSYNLLAYTDDFVQPGDTVSFNGQTMTVKDVDPVAPDGVVIIARIIVGG